MASAPILNEARTSDYTDYLEEGGEYPEGGALTLVDIMQPGVNLADLLTTSTLGEIGQKVTRDVEIDEASREDWVDRYNKHLDIAMQVKEDKSFPWPRAANVKSPILTIASIQFNAEAYPVIVDGSNLVKGRVLGPDPDGQKRARADRIGQHMTWQLLYRMPGWEEDTDRLLLILPIVGCMFRKSFYDQLENANRSETVTAQDFVINYWAKSIDTAPRYTQILHYYPHEVADLVAAGLWRAVPVEADEGDNDDDALVDFYEQHRTLDLDQDGYPEHYVVTTTKEGEVARIVPCFGPEEITVSVGGPKNTKLSQLMREAGVETLDELQAILAQQGVDLNIVKIERRQYFTKYGFIPAPDGSFYDIGFGDLLESTTDVINTLQNQMLDAASLANAGGGFIGSGVNIRGGNFRFAIGEWKRVDSPGGPLKDNFMAMPAPGPSAVSFNLLEMLYQSARDITSAQDVVAGRAPPNQPATTTLALIEQAGTVRKGIFKRIWRAFGQELRILRRLNRDYLDEQEYFQLNDAEEAVEIGRLDYADEDLDVVPVADPTQVSNTHKMARAEAIFQAFNGDILINQQRIRQNMLEAMGATDIKEYFNVPPPSPDPKMLESEAKAKAAIMDAESRRTTAQADASNKFADAATKLNAIGLIPDAATLAAHAVEESAEEDMYENTGLPHGPGGVQPMGGEPGDAGIPPLPQGAGPDLGGLVDAGTAPPGGGPGEGGAVQPTGGLGSPDGV